MDDAIETLQTCLRLLDLVHRVGEMIREGKYWGALRVLYEHQPLAMQNKKTLIYLVSGGPTSPAPTINFWNPFLRSYSILLTVASPFHQGRCISIDQVVAVRCPRERSDSRTSGFGTDEREDQEMEVEAGEGGWGETGQSGRSAGDG